MFSLNAGCSYSVGTCLFASAILLGSLVSRNVRKQFREGLGMSLSQSNWRMHFFWGVSRLEDWVVGGNSQFALWLHPAGYRMLKWNSLIYFRNRPFLWATNLYRAFWTFGISSIRCVTKQAEDKLKKTGKMTSAREERDGKNRGWSQDIKEGEQQKHIKRDKWQMFFLFLSPRSPSRF